MKILDSFTDFEDNADGLLIKRQQEIPEDFLSDLKRQREDSTSVREREFMHVASIPVIVHEKWLKEGYDCTKAPVRETLKRLREQGLDAFITTNKRV